MFTGNANHTTNASRCYVLQRDFFMAVTARSRSNVSWRDAESTIANSLSNTKYGIWCFFCKVRSCESNGLEENFYGHCVTAHRILSKSS